MNLTHSIVEVTAGDKESLLNALQSLGECDCDFCGENGEDYLWDIAKDKYDSNSDYLRDKVADIEDDEECINAFIDGWMGNDRYYIDYSVNTIKNAMNEVTAISLATVSDC